MDAQSQTTGELARALAAAQAEMPAIPMNQRADVITAKGSFSYDYADLGAIISTSLPVLTRHGLSVTQSPVGEGGFVGVRTMLLHSSGEWTANTILLPIPEAERMSPIQAVGVLLSYLRRYAWAAIVGLFCEADTDGSQETVPKPKPKSKPEAEKEKLVWLVADEAAAVMPEFDPESHKPTWEDKKHGVMKYGIPARLMPPKVPAEPEAGEKPSGLAVVSKSELAQWKRLAAKSKTDLAVWIWETYDIDINVEAVPRGLAAEIYGALEKLAKGETA